ncbi:MAG TPA: class I SAM-dependent methyltransferase [Candidatus Methylomirabilis sp.]|nr:class I SAM-dependent methyltransferase [Candidatus Methylomirabilis sp.]
MNLIKKIYFKFEKIFIRRPLKTKFFYKYFPGIFLWAKFSQTKNKNTTDYWNKTHAQEDEQQETNRFENLVLSFLDRLDFVGKDVLDVGCGRGIFLSQIKNAHSLNGVDISDAAVKIAASKGINALQRELPDLNLNQTFDIITCFETLEHTSRWRESIVQMVKLLRESGYLVISVPNEDSILINEHVAYFDVLRLYKFVQKYLTVLEIKNLGPWLLLVAQKKKNTHHERPDYFFKSL